jgi:hypothetical protein
MGNDFDGRSPRPRVSRETRGPDTLCVETGLLGDTRRPVTEKDGLIYQNARFIYGAQDQMSPRLHREFWRMLSPHWPRPRGPQSEKDELAAAAGFLLTLPIIYGAENAEQVVADLLQRPLKTLRTYRTFRRAREILERYDADGPLLPRVYGPDDDEPTLRRPNYPPDAGPLAPGAAALIDDVQRRHPMIAQLAGLAAPGQAQRRLEVSPRGEVPLQAARRTD